MRELEKVKTQLWEMKTSDDEIRPVIYGAYFRRLKLTGATVGQFRELLAPEFGLDHTQIAYLDGEVVDDGCEMTVEHEVLEFLPGCLG